MDVNDISNQVVLVMCIVAAIKRHFTQIKGWKALAAVVVVTIAMVYGMAYWDAPWPPYLEPLRQAAKVLAYAVGGHAYISGSLKKLGGGGLAAALTGIFTSQGDTTQNGDGFSRQEQPTKPELRSLPPTRNDDAPVG